MPNLSSSELQFYRDEGAMLDTLYRGKMKEWQRLTDAYDLKFSQRIRDLSENELVVASEFYPLVRSVVATVAMNYPRLFFDVHDDAAFGDDIGVDVADLLERSAASLFEITDAKPTVHQAILDALFAIGWIRTDLNPPGDDINGIANSPQEEDLVSFTRLSPGSVHVDPLTPPHKLAKARYIREISFVPIEAMRDEAQRARQAGFNWWTLPKGDDIKKSGKPADDDLGNGELIHDGHDTDEATAAKEAIENGDFVRMVKWHVKRVGSVKWRLVGFIDGQEQPVLNRPHPLMRRVFDQRTMPDGTPFWETPEGDLIPSQEPIGEPALNLEAKGADGDPGEPGVGFLTPHGFPFTPVRFDLHPTSFHPQPHLRYIEDLQNVLVESLSRKASILKRYARVTIVTAKVEKAMGAEGIRKLSRAEDGEIVIVPDGTTRDDIWVMDYSGIPAGQNDIEDRARFNIDRISKINELSQGGSGDMTATQSALIGAAVEVNRAWMEAAVSDIYVNLVRGANNIFGDPRYTPENFIINVAPDGQQRLSRALTASDFLWNYRISVQAFSMQPLFEQMQQDKILAFYDRAIASPNFDKRELDKMMAGVFDAIGDPEKLMISQNNPEAIRAAQLENQHIVLRQQDPGVLPEQDHQAHAQGHQQYQQDPTYLQIVQRAQQVGAGGIPADPQAALAIQQIDALMAQHQQAHQQAEAEQAQQIQSGGGGAGGRPSAAGPQSLISQVQSNAQEVSQSAEATQEEAMQR